MHRCTSRHPSHSQQVRCEEPDGHDGPHFHSFYMRSWDDEPVRELRDKPYGATIDHGSRGSHDAGAYCVIGDPTCERERAAARRMIAERNASPFVRRALAGELPVSDLTGQIGTDNR